MLPGSVQFGRMGHEVVEVTDPPWTVPGMLELFTASFGPAVSTQIAFAAMVVGSLLTPDREPPHATRFMVRLHTPEAVGVDRG